MSTDPDDLSYLRFTGPQQRDKAVHNLEGIVRGTALDGVLNERECEELKEWCSDHHPLLAKSVFSEIVPLLLTALKDGRIDPEEREDILWVIANSKAGSEYYNAVTSEIQQLHGMLHGIAADQSIDKAELEGLRAWLADRDFLKGSYPYDEVESLVVGVLADGMIDAEEHEHLIGFFEQFIGYSLNRRVQRAVAEVESRASGKLARGGICAVAPEIIFPERRFVFTGLSEKAKRREIGELIAKRRGELVESVPSTHYLLVGNAGNPAWAFSCYGRKVEMAMMLRKQGRPIVIVNEVDFWDALVQ